MLGVLDEFPDYCITESGDIYSYLSGKLRIIKPHLTGSGHSAVWMKRKDGVWKKMKVHRVVALTFLPNPKALPIVEHRDDNKQNNRKENLFWSTQKENMRAVAKGGKKSPKTAVTLIKDGIEVGTYPSLKECARENDMNYYKLYRWFKGYYAPPDGYEIKLA